MGPDAQLPAIINNGYSYITSDKGRTFVDVSDTTRIQLTPGKMNVDIVTDGQVLTYDATNEEWIAKDPDKEVFIAVQGSTTYLQIANAWMNGKAIFLKRAETDSYFLPLMVATQDDSYIFGGFIPDGDKLKFFKVEVFSDNSWSAGINQEILMVDPDSGTENQVLTKTSTGYDWKDASGGETEVFIATYGTTTYVEIQAALDAGKTVFCKKIYTGGSQYAILTNQTETQFEFTNAWIEENTLNDYEGAGGAIIYRCQESGWSAYQQDLNNVFWVELNQDTWATQWEEMTEALAAHKIVLCRASVSYNSSFSSEYVTLRLVDEFTQNNNVNRVFYGFDLDYATGSYSAMVTLWANNSRWQFNRTLLDQAQKIYLAINRTTNVNVADTNYTTLMARGEKLLDATTFDAVTDWSTELVNGSICWRYE